MLESQSCLYSPSLRNGKGVVVLSKVNSLGMHNKSLNVITEKETILSSVIA